MNLKVFIFSKMNPELNAIVLFGKAGRKMELPIGFDVNGVIIDQHNEEEFDCEEVKPMLFRISHNGGSILVGSHRHPKKLHSHKNGGYITQDPHPAVMREGELAFGSRRGNKLIFRENGPLKEGNRSVTVTSSGTTHTVKVLIHTGNVTRIDQQIDFYLPHIALEMASYFLGKKLYVDGVIYG
nr:MAG TPA: hypothetical protein [Caudoviricetes sp.]